MSQLQLKRNPTLKDFQKYVEQLTVERDFDREDVAKKFMMFFEEVGEFAKASRKISGMKLADDAAKQNVFAEAADVFIVLLGPCNMLGIDLEQAFRDKEEINKRRVWR